MADEELTDAEFERFLALIYQVAGIRIPDIEAGDGHQPAPTTAEGHRHRHVRRLLCPH